MFQLSFAASDTGGPLYDQLYRAIVAQIRHGELAPGERLPGKRSLAAELSVSVNTVDTAYQLLVAEGYLEARPRSGFFVQHYTGPKTALPGSAPAPRPADVPVWRYDLSTGGIDTALFPFRTWGRIQKELLYSQPQLLSHGHPQGDEDLRQAIADYLHAYRAVDCAPDQIVVGAGVEYLLGLLARLVEGPAAVEDPGYGRTRRILQSSGVPCLPVPVDQQGLVVEKLAETDARLAYVTPSHQFPTGAVMPAGRRAALLQWALAAPGRYILEDDYDSEFRFALQAGQRRAGGVSFHLLPQSCPQHPHRLHGAAPGSAGPLCGAVRLLLLHREPVRTADPACVFAGGPLHPPSCPLPGQVPHPDASAHRRAGHRLRAGAAAFFRPAHRPASALAGKKRPG